MSNIIKLANRDFRNIIKNKGFWISFSIALFYVLIWLHRKPKTFQAENYQFEFFRVVLFIIIYYSSVMLSKEFKFGTVKNLFTGAFTRVEILVEKLLVVMQLGLFLGIISRLLNIAIIYYLTGTISMSDIINENTVYSLIIYLIISLVIGSFALLITLITKNQNATLIYTFLFFAVFQYFMPLFIMINSQKNLSIIDEIITKLPNYVIYTWAEIWQFTGLELIVMFAYVVIFFIPSIFIISKKSLR